jgi:hypothetical protein
MSLPFSTPSYSPGPKCNVYRSTSSIANEVTELMPRESFHLDRKIVKGLDRLLIDIALAPGNGNVGSHLC